MCVRFLTMAVKSVWFEGPFRVSCGKEGGCHVMENNVLAVSRRRLFECSPLIHLGPNAGVTAHSRTARFLLPSLFDGEQNLGVGAVGTHTRIHPPSNICCGVQGAGDHGEIERHL